ncbi:MAG: shikimate kinase [Terriglobia bacterium]
MNARPVPIRRLLFLLGFMGCGKSTVGRLLAEQLGWRFLDLDTEIESRQRRTINQIFSEKGEPYFRQVERGILQEILDGSSELALVVALGGGTFAQPGAADLIRARGGVTVWLDCPLEELRRRCRDVTDRPLARDAATFQQLYLQRLPFYQRADFRVDAHQSDPRRVVEEIVQCSVF